MRNFFSILGVLCGLLSLSLSAKAQGDQSISSANSAASPAKPPQPGQLPDPPAPPDKRVFGVLPNYRTANMESEYHPITPKMKMTIALKDSFDYPLVFLGAAYAGLYQLEDSHHQFGQGMAGYARRFGTSYTDQVVGNMMTEGILPILLHEDPRYFRLGQGKKWHRTGYALSRIFVTHTDSGRQIFNFAEVGGNAIASGIGLSYYSDNRNVPDFMQNWGTQLATDAMSQVLKEFWPDVKRKLFKRHSATPAD